MKGGEIVTINEIKDKLSQERTFGSRYPARIIFTESLDSYSLLESHLKGICDVTINIADFCKAPDTVPQFEQVKKKLCEYPDQQVLLLSVGEYLRLCAKRELNVERRQFRAFWESQQSESSRTRVIIPVFSCRDIFDRIVGSVDERQVGYVWTLETESQPASASYSVSVYSPKFKDSIHADAENLTTWFQQWPTILREDPSCSIVTMQYLNVEASYGTVNIKPIDSPFRYLMDILVDGDVLSEKWQTDEFWSRMVVSAARYEGRKMIFGTIVLDSLNVNEFDFVSIAARWKTLSDYQKTLVWMWYRAYPTDEYYCYACNKAEKPDEIPIKLRDEIFYLSSRSDKWIKERMAAVKALAFQTFDDAYFAAMDKLPLPETKLQLLTYQTHEEKAYAIKVVCAMLRGGAEPDAVAELFELDYPALSSYLRDKTGIDPEVDQYMTWYRKNKIINRYPGEYSTQISFDRFDPRAMLMHKIKNEDCAYFWIDGFGIEYAPLFIKELKSRGIIPVSVAIGTAKLPTETVFNHQWDEKDPRTTKWDRLDSLSHRGIPDDKSYFSCIVRQLSVFAEAAKKAEELLEEHEYVVITGDHGSSRFAALAFHDKSVVPVAPPKKAIVHSFGRFCELDPQDKDTIAISGSVKVEAIGKTYLVMNGYQNFSISGNVASGNTDDKDVVGEAHGGNTAEERLVTVVILKRKHPLPPVICTPKSKQVVKRNGHIETNFAFSRPISSLEVSLGKQNKATCVENPDGTWRIILDDIKEETLRLTVIADGRLLPSITLKVKPQGMMNNDGMGI